MAQTKISSTRQDPHWLYAVAMLLTGLACGTWFWQQIYPPGTPLIHWRKPSEALNEAARTDKPVLYVFSARWCGPCKAMEETAFSRKKIADIMNNQFIPVHVIDESHELGKNPPAIERLQTQCDVQAFPTVVVVPANLLDGKADDIYSPSNGFDRRMIFMEYSFMNAEQEPRYQEWAEETHQRFPASIGYDGANQFEQYLYKAERWHKLPASKGRVHWDTTQALTGVSKKPKLIAFVEDHGSLSDRLRYGLFENSDSSTFIDEHFVPILVELHRSKVDSGPADLLALKDKFGIKALPALVVVNANGKPEIEDGFTSREHSMQFFKRALGL